LAEGLGDGVGVVCTPLARGLLVLVTVGTATAFGPVLAKYRASGTTIMPTMTASTKVTAPHSRLMKAQLTRREF
jgi:pantothenate kinase type III